MRAWFPKNNVYLNAVALCILYASGILCVSACGGSPRRRPARSHAESPPGSDTSTRGTTRTEARAEAHEPTDEELQGPSAAAEDENLLEGFATYYSDRLHGRRTASGERYDRSARTAAHRTLPFGTRLRVERVGTDLAVEVRVNDRGPFGSRRERILDLSGQAANDLQMRRAGVVRVRIYVLP